MTEALLLGYIRKLAQELGLLVYHCKDSRGSDPGLPDLILVGRGVLWAELKPTQGDLRFWQKLWVRRLRDAGQSVEIWRPGDWHSGRIQREMQVIAPPSPFDDGEEAA